MEDLLIRVSIEYREGYVQAVRDVLFAYEEAQGVRTRKQSIAWLTCLAFEPERLMGGKNIDMEMMKTKKDIKYVFCEK